VSDRSTDRTDDIVAQHLVAHDFIRLVRRSGAAGRSFASKAEALRLGYAQLADSGYGYIGNLDADVSFDPDYYERMVGAFRADPLLGVAGGAIYEDSGKGFVSRPFNSRDSVAGAVQMFRRECFEAIGGGYLPLYHGAVDTWAEVCARMRGWHVRSFPEAHVYHHRRTSSAGRRILSARFRQGQADFGLGSHPAFEILRCLHRVSEPPFVLGAVFRMTGYLCAALSSRERMVTPEFVRYLRSEQADRLRQLLVRG
jgi:GT2 family glycosyltransferase